MVSHYNKFMHGNIMFSSGIFGWVYLNILCNPAQQKNRLGDDCLVELGTADYPLWIVEVSEPFCIPLHYLGPQSLLHNSIYSTQRLPTNLPQQVSAPYYFVEQIRYITYLTHILIRRFRLLT